MERELFTKLERWMRKKNRKPLIIQGARQVGKTWIMKEFGARFYENTVYINFDNNKAMKDGDSGNRHDGSSGYCRCYG